MTSGGHVQDAELHQPIQEEMEIKQTGIRAPFCDCLVYGFVIQWALYVQPPLEVVSSPNIVPRKQVGSTESTQQNILSRPSPDTAQFRLEVSIESLLRFDAVGNAKRV